MQVNLCGHATLAASHTLFSSGLLVDSDVIEFVTLSGLLTAKKVPPSDLQNDQTQHAFYIELNFPADPVADFHSAEISHISEALTLKKGASIIDIKKTQNGDDLLVIPKPVLFHYY